MQYLFENGDILNSPYEAFLADSSVGVFPVRPHWHYFTEVLFMLEGTALVECDGKTYSVEPEELILFHPKSIHSVCSTSKEPLRYAVLKFDANILSVGNSYTPKISAILESARNSDCAHIHFKEINLFNMHMKERFLDCIHELSERNYGYDIKVHSQLCNMMVCLIRLWRDNGFNTDKSFIVSGNDESTLNNITEYIDQHSDELLRVEDLAKRCSMSYSYFAKNFKALYNKSCKEYIEFVRICKADDMLLFTDFNLNYISQETGFTDCSHFIKTYKKLKGITPKQRRLKYQLT